MSASRTSTMLTTGGRTVDLLNITPEDIDLADISWALAHICRFSGHVRRHYSVAEHSINVARLLPEPIKIYGLLHDAHEAYIGDISTPMKLALKAEAYSDLIDSGVEDVIDDGFFERILTNIERPIIKAIHNKLGVPWPVSHHVMAAVKYADVTMVEHELQQLFDGPRVPKAELPMPSWDIEDNAEWPFIDIADKFEVMARALTNDLRAAA